MAKWALITGASAGIGRDLARVFAAEGWNVVLTARDGTRLEELSGKLKRETGVQTRIITQDLAAQDAAGQLFDAVREPITALVNNAGFGSYGLLSQTDFNVQSAMVQVNVMALFQLTHLFLPGMLERRDGYILNVASTAAFQPGPTMSVYYASKAFVYSFTYALAAELDGTHVSATALCPGLTRSEFADRAGMRMHPKWPAMESMVVARAGYNGMITRKRVVVPGWLNRLTSTFSPRLPVSWTSALARRVHEKQATLQ